MANALGQDASHYYIWRASNDFAIHLSIHAVTQLAAQIGRAGSHGRSGELRGILLGRSAADEHTRASVIEDIELIPPCDDAGNQDAEDTLLEIACRKVRNDENRRVLGFFRSRHDGRLNMGSRDREIFGRLFSESGNVALLIQTSKRGNESDAALFYWERGGAQPRDFGFGFPFDAGQLVAGHPGWRFPDPLDDSPAVAALPPSELEVPEPAPIASTPITDWSMPPPPVPLPTPSSIRWTRLVPTIVLVALAIGTIQLLTGSKHPVVQAASATEAPADAPPEAASHQIVNAALVQQAVSSDHFLGLTVNSKQHQLEIRWNRESAAITGAEKGQMKITEDGITEALPFDQSQLRDGYVAYTPKTNDVNIRLEVTAKDGSTKSESLRSVAIP